MTLHEIDQEIKSINSKIQELKASMPKAMTLWPKEDMMILRKLERTALYLDAEWWAQLTRYHKKADVINKLINSDQGSQERAEHIS